MWGNAHNVLRAPAAPNGAAESRLELFCPRPSPVFRREDPPIPWGISRVLVLRDSGDFRRRRIAGYWGGYVHYFTNVGLIVLSDVPLPAYRAERPGRCSLAAAVLSLMLRAPSVPSLTAWSESKSLERFPDWITGLPPIGGRCRCHRGVRGQAWSVLASALRAVA